MCNLSPLTPLFFEEKEEENKLHSVKSERILTNKYQQNKRNKINCVPNLSETYENIIIS